jgi:hypothetical protein
MEAFLTDIPFFTAATAADMEASSHDFIFDHPIVCKTVKFTDQLDNRSWHVLRFYKVG